MMVRRGLAILVMIMFLGLSVLGALSGSGPTPRPAQTSPLDVPPLEVPVRTDGCADMASPSVFYENKGQECGGAGRFYVHGAGRSVAFGTGWFSYWLSDGDGQEALVRIEMVGAAEVVPEGENLQDGRANFLYGSDPEAWIRGVELHKEIWYRSLWPGIDLVFRLEGGKLKYEFLLGPMADPDDIQMRFRGADSVVIDPLTGDLIIRVIGEVLRDKAPNAFQGADGPLREVECALQALTGDSVGFKVGTYDVSRPLVIDPGIIFSTLIGGQQQDSPTSLTTDEEGNIYITGFTRSDGFPTTPGSLFPDNPEYRSNSGFVIKLGPSGKDIKFSTYIGGNMSDRASDVALDVDGSMYLVGSTTSGNFPTTEGAYCTTLTPSSETLPGTNYTIPSLDAFVLKIDPKGQDLEFSTFIGGTNDDGADGICIDDEGSLVVVGSTDSVDFPMAGTPYQSDHGKMDTAETDIFFLRLSADGTKLLYSSYLGGDRYDWGARVLLDGDGNMVMSGYTTSSDLPYTADAFDKTLGTDINGLDGFVLKFNFTTNRPEYLTLVGGDKKLTRIVTCLDEDGTVYFAGASVEDNAIVSPNGTTYSWDVMVGRLSSDGSNRLFFESFGGSQWETPSDIEVDHAGRIYVQGTTTSGDFPTTEGAVCSTFVRVNLCFLTVLNHNASEILYSTYYGSTGRDGASGMELDDQGAVIMTGDVMLRGDTYDPWTDFPTTHGPLTSETRVAWVTTYLIKIHPMLVTPDVLNLTDGNVLYAGYRAYDFQVDANPFRAVEGPRRVVLTLDPDGANVRVIWELVKGIGDSFTEDDPDGLIDLDRASSDGVWDGLNNTFFIHFLIEPDWKWPHENLCDVQVDIYDTYESILLSIVVEDAFRVENDLDMVGDLEPEGEWQGPLSEGDWVRANETVVFKGVQVVYEGTTEVHPPASTCSAQVKDDGGLAISGIVREEGVIYVSFKVDEETDADEVFTLSLVALPTGATSSATRSIHLPVDGQGPRFTRFIPEPEDWHSSGEVLLSMTADDGSTSGVDSGTFEYQVCSEGPEGFGPWQRTDLEVTPPGPSADAMVEVHLPDGDDNLVRWRVSDLVGNVVTSDDLVVKVDTINVSFRSPVPDTDAWSTDLLVLCGVTIQDMDGSGIDVSTVQYRFSPHNLSNYESWLDWDEGQTPDSIIVKTDVEVEFANTKYNYVQWRAYDLAGNGLTTSRHYRVQVDTSPVVFSDFSPGADDWSRDLEVRCTITAYDGPLGSGVNQSSIDYRYRPSGGDWTEWSSAGMTGVAERQRFSVVIPLAEGTDNIVQFRVWDVAGNGPTVSDEYMVNVDTTPPQAMLGNVDRVHEDDETATYRIWLGIQDAASGLDTGSVLVNYGEDKANLISDWTPVTVTEETDGYSAIIDITVPSFMAPVLGIKARDTAGNEMEMYSTPIHVNRPPVAVIESPLDGSIHVEGEAIFLSSNGSFDPDGGSISFSWRIEDANGTDNLSRQLVEPEGVIDLPAGIYVIRLTVIDSKNVVNMTAVGITVEPAPGPRVKPTEDFPYLLFLLVLLASVSAVAFYIWHRGRMKE